MACRPFSFGYARFAVDSINQIGHISINLSTRADECLQGSQLLLLDRSFAIQMGCYEVCEGRCHQGERYRAKGR